MGNKQNSIAKENDNIEDNKFNDKIIKLNVGGYCQLTLLSTLLKRGDNYFSKRFGRKYPTGPMFEDAYFIDRDGELFDEILHHLRDGKVIFHSSPTDIYLLRLLVEADFYELPDLQREIMKCLENKEGKQRKEWLKKQQYSNASKQ